MKSEFNKDGSLKLPEELIKNKQEESNSIVLRRIQINTNHPAIAQVRIEFPRDVENPEKIINYYKQIKDERFKSVDHTMKRVDKRTFVIEVKRGSKFMYSLLEYLIECFEDKLKNKNKVIITGVWDKFT